LGNLVSWEVKMFRCLTCVCREDASSGVQIRHSPSTAPQKSRSKPDNGALKPRIEVTSQSRQYHLEKRKIYTSPANQCSKSDLPFDLCSIIVWTKVGRVHKARTLAFGA